MAAWPGGLSIDLWTNAIVADRFDEVGVTHVDFDVIRRRVGLADMLVRRRPPNGRGLVPSGLWGRWVSYMRTMTSCPERASRTVSAQIAAPIETTMARKVHAT
jgi:hypothetical protein